MSTSEVQELPRRSDSFLSASLHNNPLLYPGQTPEVSFVTNGEMVEALRFDPTEGLSSLVVSNGGADESLDEYLARHNASPLQGRIPIIGYGANINPGSLIKKFGKNENRPDLMVVPTVYASLPDHDVVWSGGPGINGNFIANLYAGEEVEGTDVRVGLNLVTPEQALMLHATELSYQLSPVEVKIGSVGLKAYFYAGQDSVHLRYGRPVAVREVPATDRRLDEATTREMLHGTLAMSEVQTMLHEAYPQLDGTELDADRYVAFIRSLKKPKGSQETPRGDLKARMAASLRDLGLVRVVDSSQGGNFANWANPATLDMIGNESPTGSMVYRVPEMELPFGEWQGEAVQAERRKILKAVGTHHQRMSGLEQVIADESRGQA